MRDRLIYFVYFGVVLICLTMQALDARADGMDGREYYYKNVYPLEYKGVSVSRGVLLSVNREVNRRIIPTRDKADEWKINPKRGDCEDFALTKLVELFEKGVPLKGMRLARGRAWGENHMVLVVKTGGEEIVLDNLASELYMNNGRYDPIINPVK